MQWRNSRASDLGESSLHGTMKYMKHTAKITPEWLRNPSQDDLEWSSQSSAEIRMEYFWRDLKMAVHRCSIFSRIKLARKIGKF